MTNAEYAQKYPLHAKLKAHMEEQRIAQDFIEFLTEGAYVIAQRDENASRWLQYNGYDLYPTSKRPEEIIGEFLGIDAKALSDEKDRMYDELVQAQQGKADGSTECASVSGNDEGGDTGA